MGLFLFSGSCQDARVLKCPAVFRKGANLWNCSVNTTAVAEAGCRGVGVTIIFQIILPGQLPLITCDTDFNKCDTKFNSASCRCMSHTSDLRRYQLNFSGNSSIHTNGKFDCIILCLRGSLPLTAKDPSCDRVKFRKSTCLVCVCVCPCVRACVRACVCVCV